MASLRSGTSGRLQGRTPLPALGRGTSFYNIYGPTGPRPSPTQESGSANRTTGLSAFLHRGNVDRHSVYPREGQFCGRRLIATKWCRYLVHRSIGDPPVCVLYPQTQPSERQPPDSDVHPGSSSSAPARYALCCCLVKRSCGEWVNFRSSGRPLPIAAISAGPLCSAAVLCFLVSIEQHRAIATI